MNYRSILLVSALALATGVASAATVTRSSGSSGSLLISPDNCTDGVVDSGIELRGCLNQNKGIGVLIQSDGESLKFDANGQARVEAADGLFDYARILFSPEENLGMTELILNVDASANSGVTFTIEFYVGANESVSFAAPPPNSTDGLRQAGQNFYTITAGAGQVIKAVTVGTPTQVIEKVEQVRILFVNSDGSPGPGPDPNTDVPAPASLALLGAGLAALGLRRVRRG